MDSAEFTLSVVEWAHHKFAHEVAIAVVFGNNVVAVVEVRGGVAIDRLFDAPAGRVIFVGDGVPVCRIVARTEACPLHVVHPAAIVTFEDAAVLDKAPLRRTSARTEIRQ